MNVIVSNKYSAMLSNLQNKIDLIKNVTISFMTERLTFDCNESDLNDALKLIKKIIRREEPDVSIKEL